MTYTFPSILERQNPAKLLSANLNLLQFEDSITKETFSLEIKHNSIMANFLINEDVTFIEDDGEYSIMSVNDEFIIGLEVI